MFCGLIFPVDEKSSFPDERSLAQIIYSIRENFSKQKEFDDITARFIYFVDLSTAVEKIKDFTSVGQKLLGDCIYMSLVTRDPNLQNPLYWNALEEMARCFDDNKISQKALEYLRKHYSSAAEKLEKIMEKQ